MELKRPKSCNNCGSTNVPLYWLLSNGTGKRYCSDCYHAEYLKYLKNMISQ